MRRLGRNLRQRQPSARLTLDQRIAALFRRYGAGAHVYLPGIGVINGITAANYLDSAGTTAATVDNPVGLVLDAANSQLGSELVTNGGPFNNTAGWITASETPLSVSDGNLLVSSATAQDTLVYGSWLSGSPQNKYFEVKVIITSITGRVRLKMYGVNITGSWITSPGTYTFRCYQSVVNSSIGFNSDAAASISISSFSVKQITGKHAIQATTASKPILRNTGGKYSWQFDATDLLTATFPVGYEAATIIDATVNGQVTRQSKNIVGAHGLFGGVLATDYMTNGNFDANTAGWNPSNANASLTWQAGGTALFANTADWAYVRLAAPPVLAAGLYLIEFAVTAVSGAIHIGAGSSGNSVSSAGNKQQLYNHTGGAMEIQIRPIAVGLFTAEVDSFSIRQVLPNSYGRIVFKTAPSAADLAVMQRFANRLAGL